MRVAALLAACLLVSCAGRCSGARADREAPQDDEPLSLDPPPLVDGGALAPARCGERTSIRRAQWIGQVALGASADRDGRFVVSAVMDAAPALSVLRVDEQNAERVDVRVNPGDAPAPALASRGDELFAAYFGENESSAKSVVQKQTAWVVQIGEGGATPRFRVAREREESLVLDLAVGAEGPQLVWQTAAGVSVHTASNERIVRAPEGTVLEAPRIVASNAHSWVLAIARRWDTLEYDPAPPGGKGPPRAPISKIPQTQWEGAGEPRSNSWLVGVKVPSAGEIGAVHALTSPRGHVEAFEVLPDGDGVQVVAFDAAGVLDEGASLVRLRWSGAAPERDPWHAPDVGQGALSLLPAAEGRPMLVYHATNGDGVLVWGAQVSREPTLADTRVLAAQGGRLLVSTSEELGWVKCAP